jgi:hypothetical protein
MTITGHTEPGLPIHSPEGTRELRNPQGIVCIVHYKLDFVE